MKYIKKFEINESVDLTKSYKPKLSFENVTGEWLVDHEFPSDVKEYLEKTIIPYFCVFLYFDPNRSHHSLGQLSYLKQYYSDSITDFIENPAVSFQLRTNIEESFYSNDRHWFSVDDLISNEGSMPKLLSIAEKIEEFNSVRNVYISVIDFRSQQITIIFKNTI
jgi:hypothetical protein